MTIRISIPNTWREAARREGLSLLAWIRAACELAIARVRRADVSPTCQACRMSTAEAALHAGQGRAPIVVEPLPAGCPSESKTDGPSRTGQDETPANSAISLQRR